MKETVKSDEGKKAAANLAIYSLSVDKYITNTVKESKLRKASEKYSWYKMIFNLLSKAIKKQLWKS